MRDVEPSTSDPQWIRHLIGVLLPSGQRDPDNTLVGRVTSRLVPTPVSPNFSDLLSSFPFSFFAVWSMRYQPATSLFETHGHLIRHVTALR
jgi:hypothetical protein